MYDFASHPLNSSSSTVARLSCARLSAWRLDLSQSPPSSECWDRYLVGIWAAACRVSRQEQEFATRLAVRVTPRQTTQHRKKWRAIPKMRSAFSARLSMASFPPIPVSSPQHWLVNGALTQPFCLVMENEKVVAFLDINPLHPGHTLIVPKGHYASLDQLPAALAGSSSFLLHR